MESEAETDQQKADALKKQIGMPCFCLLSIHFSSFLF